MKKILSLVVLFGILLFSSAEAMTKDCDIQSVIDEFGVDKDSIAISIKTEDGKKFFSLNEKMLMTPASVQKILTTPVIVDTLGENYEFSTELYSRGECDYLIKLGADPYLVSADLKKLVSAIEKSPQKLFINDTIVDTKTWGEGWQWDDDMNNLMPRFGAYNLDRNLIKLTIMPTQKGQFATIINPSKYPLVFFNNIETSDKTNIKVVRDNSVSANTLVLTGTISRPTTVYIPSNNLKQYFKVQVQRVLEQKNIYFKETFLPSQLDEKDVLLTKVTHSIEPAISDILKLSDNRVSETLFKLAGGKHCNVSIGTDFAGIKMFNDYCAKFNLDNSRIRIADASGVSKNNLVSADFITEFLNVNKKNPIMDKLAKPGEGTLIHRMLPIKDNLKAKTGTLSDVSSIAGYLTSRSGKKFVFCIMTNDITLSDSDKKMLEDFILRELYMKQ